MIRRNIPAGGVAPVPIGFIDVVVDGVDVGSISDSPPNIDGDQAADPDATSSSRSSSSVFDVRLALCRRGETPLAMVDRLGVDNAMGRAKEATILGV